MKSWVSMLAAACLLGSNVPVYAQFNPRVNVGPLTRSAMAEAVRVATLERQSAPAPEQWDAVRRISPRTEITVIRTDKSEQRGYFSSADGISITVVAVNTDDHSALPITILATDVSEVRQRATSKGSTLGAVIGAAVGLSAGLFFLAANMETRCQPNCGYIAMAPLYMSAGGGALGYFGAAKRSDGVIFRRN
jgi:hypothetical protein